MMTWRGPDLVAGVYAVASVLCFIAYAVDKFASQTGRRRTSERTLLLYGLACGWPGALLAQQFLRHKTSKVSFRRRFWATVVFNIAGLTALTYYSAL